MARSAYREAVGYFEQALSALPHLPEPQRHAEQAIDLRLRSALGAPGLGDFARILVLLREAEALARRSTIRRRLGRVSLYAGALFLSAWAPMTRLLRPASAPLPLPRRAGMSPCRCRRTTFWGALPRSGVTISRAIESCRQTSDVLDRRTAYERFGQVYLPAVFSRAWLAWCLAELGAFAEGDHHWGGSAPHCRGGGAPCEPMLPTTGSVCWPSVKGDLPRALPLLERAWASVRRRRPAQFPHDRCGPGCGVCSGRAFAEAVPLLEQAIRADHDNVMGGMILTSLPG